jgi:hypothetical protein
LIHSVYRFYIAAFARTLSDITQQTLRFVQNDLAFLFTASPVALTTPHNPQSVPQILRRVFVQAAPREDHEIGGLAVLSSSNPQLPQRFWK